MPPVNPALERLIKLLGMTDSDQDGEALTAIRMANKLLKDNRWTYHQLLANAPAAAPRPSDFELKEEFDRGYARGREAGIKEGKDYKRKHPYDHITDDHREQWRQANVWYSKFSTKAQEFLDGLSVRFDRGYELTPKQAEWLGDLYRKARGYSYQRDQAKKKDQTWSA